MAQHPEIVALLTAAAIGARAAAAYALVPLNTATGADQRATADR